MDLELDLREFFKEIPRQTLTVKNYPVNLLAVRNLTKRQKAYRKYLLTRHWKRLRETVLERDGYSCAKTGSDGARCGCRENLHVHHLLYRRKFRDSKPEDLITLCSVCHKLEHGIPVYFSIDYLLQDFRCKATLTHEQERQLVFWTLNVPSYRWEAESILRDCAEIRYWKTLKRYMPDMFCSRLVPWAREKFDRIWKETQEDPPPEYVRQTLRKHV